MAKIDKLVDATPNAVVTERQDLRQYPQGTVTQSLLGVTGWDGHGTGGIETKYDTAARRHGRNSHRRCRCPGRSDPRQSRDETAAVDGGAVTLTIDANLQYTAAQMLHSAIVQTGSRGGSAS